MYCVISFPFFIISNTLSENKCITTLMCVLATHESSTMMRKILADSVYVLVQNIQKYNVYHTLKV